MISPLLSNIYLHEVLDSWFERQVRPRLGGRAELIRFADDFVIVFEQRNDAQRVWEKLPKRFGRYGLAIQEAKSRLLDFSRPAGRGQKPEVFEFLGFTHYWGKSRKGNRVVKRKTSGRKLRKAIKWLYLWCKANRHMPVAEQWAMLCLKLRGHYGYYGITGNIRSLRSYCLQAKRSWRKWLNRRSRGKHMPWDRFNRLLERYPLPEPRIVHQYS